MLCTTDAYDAAYDHLLDIALRVLGDPEPSCVHCSGAFDPTQASWSAAVLSSNTATEVVTHTHAPVAYATGIPQAPIGWVDVQGTGGAPADAPPGDLVNRLTKCQW